MPPLAAVVTVFMVVGTSVSKWKVWASGAVYEPPAAMLTAPSPPLEGTVSVKLLEGKAGEMPMPNAVTDCSTRTVTVTFVTGTPVTMFTTRPCAVTSPLFINVAGSTFTFLPFRLEALATEVDRFGSGFEALAKAGAAAPTETAGSVQAAVRTTVRLLGVWSDM